MEKLIIVRHGDYDGGGLTELGQSQIVALAEKLKSVVNGGSVRVLSSSALRALKSAEIISVTLGLQFEVRGVLYSPPFDYEGVLRLITESIDKYTTLLLVGHLECAECLPWYFGSKLLGKALESSKIKKGQALVIDCVSKSIEPV